MSKTTKSKAGGIGGRRVSEDLNWLRSLFMVPAVDQGYGFRGELVLDPTGGVNPVQSIEVTTPEDLASIERELLVEPLDSWSGRNSRFDVLYKGKLWNPGHQYVTPATFGGFHITFPRNFVIPMHQNITLRWTSLTAFGNPAWRYYVEGFIANEVLE